jgi:ribulose kinase
MSIAAGVDFATPSVRVTLVATNRGKLRSGNQVAALAIDTTGSNVIPVDEKLEPLGEYASLRRIAAARGNP